MFGWPRRGRGRISRDNVRRGTATEVIEGRREQVVKFGLSSKIDDEAFGYFVRYNSHTHKAEKANISHGMRINDPWFIDPLIIGCVCLSEFPTSEGLGPRDG